MERGVHKVSWYVIELRAYAFHHGKDAIHRLSPFQYHLHDLGGMDELHDIE